ncbi:hypothetical protein B7R22_16575 [Subtercola boreus]|uniref:Uncharacterized protein n=1 Tax=Subtercola boreus TaxID=120213 RepID=A0A3E0VQI0_9MICO|nr:hypothetical protein [Subtercola boreus]RFA12242.1 hypothetical protein B7R22_16575 [Subtercola boreus]
MPAITGVDASPTQAAWITEHPFTKVFTDRVNSIPAVPATEGCLSDAMSAVRAPVVPQMQADLTGSTNLDDALAAAETDANTALKNYLEQLGWPPPPGEGILLTALHAVAAAVKDAVLPVSVPVADYQVTPVLENPYWGHLSLAGHELGLNPRHVDEIGDYLLRLPIPPAPPQFVADTVSLFEFHADWGSEWWRQLSWNHLRSWQLS